METQVIIPDAAGLQELLSQLGRYDQDVIKKFRTVMSSLVKTGKKRVKSYMRSWDGPNHEPAKNYVASKVKVDPPNQIFGHIFPGGQHRFWARIEMTGRNAGRMADPRDLEQWAVDKLGVPAEQAKQVAFALAKKIGRTGMKGSNAAERARGELEALASEKFSEAMDEILEYMAR